MSILSALNIPIQSNMFILFYLQIPQLGLKLAYLIKEIKKTGQRTT